MAGTNSTKGGKGGGHASNAALQDDEDRLFRGKHFREWAKSRREKRIIGTPIVYDKSPAPPKK